MEESLVLQYIKRFGPEALPPTMQMPAEQTTDEFLEALFARCLREGKPASEYITVEEMPGVLY